VSQLLYDKNMIILRKYSDTNLTPSENEEGTRVALMSHFGFFAVFECVVKEIGEVCGLGDGIYEGRK
jgi:hypothetical protein